MYHHAAQTFESVKSNLAGHIRGMFPVEGKVHRLVLRDLEIRDHGQTEDYEAQRRARMSGDSWSIPVFASLELQDLGGRVVDKARMKIIDLPRLTNRGSYIVHGTEYMFPVQKRLRSGPYVRTGENGELRTFFNLAKGRNFHLGLHPEKGHFQLQVESSKNIALYPLLRALGVEDSQMIKAWGQEAWQANVVKDQAQYQKTLALIWEKMSYGAEKPDAGQLPGALAELFAKTRVDPVNCDLTVGVGDETVTGRMILAAATKMLKVARGQEEEDNRDSLIHNDIVDLGDFIVERFQDRQFRDRITRTIRFNIDRRNKISQIVSRDAFQRPVDSMMTESQLAQTPTQSNPLGMLSDYTQITVRGEGGIQQENALTRGLRALDPSHLGFVDPAHTPEGSGVGTTLHLTVNTEKRGKDLVTRVLDVKTGKIVDKTPVEIFRSVVAFPEHVKNGKLVGGQVTASHRGKIGRHASGAVNYAFVKPEHLIDINTSTIPFVSHNNGTRVMTASKMGLQAKPLADPDAPVVQVDSGEGQTVEKIIGESFSPKSPVDGIVEKISEDHIVISGNKVQLPRYFPLNSNNFMHAEPTVKVGDKVSKDQVVADTNYTKGGTLALGKNLLVAYVPYKGMNVEDGVVMSDDAAKKMASEHMYQQSYLFDQDTVLDLKKYQAYFPAKLTGEQASKLDDQGVVKKGQEVRPGDVLISSMRRHTPTTESQRLAAVSKILAKEFRDDSLTWDKDVTGYVQDVAKRAREIVVFVRTKEPIRIGDKIVGRYGNKGIVVQIIPSDEMPKDAKGRSMDLLLNPNGVVSRMNLGQILETTASRVAEKTGKPFSLRGFGADSAKAIEDELKKHGLKDHETISDPVEGIDIPGVLVGRQHIYKLEHQVTKKIGSRGGGSDWVYTSDQQPIRGPEGGRAVGSMELYALLAHGAVSNISEMYGFKSNFDYETWKAIESGAPLPPPKPSHATQKFMAMLRGMGVDVEKRGTDMAMVPFLDRQVSEISNGEVTNFQLLRGKDLKEEKDGLFDVKKTGGVKGEQWTHISLPEPLPSPTFEDAVCSLLHIPHDELNDIISGKKKVGALTGGRAVKFMLDQIDVEKRIQQVTKEIVGKKGSDLNKLHRELRYLRTLKDNGIKPGEYVITKLPVLPPKFRPVYTLSDGNLRVSDVNFHYQATMQIADQMKKLTGPQFEDQRRKLAAELYKSVGGVMGFNDGVVERTPAPKGIAGQISGVGSPKGGFFHEKLLKKRQDVSGNTVIVSDPTLGLDEVGVPEAVAWNVFRPFAIRELRVMGMTPLQAKDAMDKRSDVARKALENVIKDRHVILNRAPTLHKFSVMAFKPRLVPGHALKIPPLIVGGFNADFDGDRQLNSVFIFTSEDARIASELPREWWDLRKIGGEDMAARFGVFVPVVRGGEFHVIDLADFPHDRESRAVQGGRVDFHAVPDDVFVLSQDDNGRVVAARVSAWSRHRDCETIVINLKNGKQILADDDPRAVYGIDSSTMTFGRWRPSESVGKMVPVASRPSSALSASTRDKISLNARVSASERANVVVKNLELSHDSGYFIGAVIGDGWVSGRLDSSRQVNMCCSDEGVRDKWSSAARLFFVDDIHVSEQSFDREDITGETRSSSRLVLSSVALAELMSELVGRGAENKHLPPFFVSSSQDFRLGILAGLLDTDGNVSWNDSRKKPQSHIQYATTSSRLAIEVKFLCASLGIRSSITTSSTSKGGNFYVVNIRPGDIYSKDIRLAHTVKRENLHRLSSQDPPDEPSGSGTELVPMGGELAAAAMSVCRAAGYDVGYVQASKSKSCGYVSRTVAGKICELASGDKRFDFLRVLVENLDVSWSPVTSFEATGIVEDGYDLTVPGYETFMAVDGVILSNTMGIHVPVTPEANAEAAEMLPSKHLYKPGSGKLQPKIEHEYVLGMFKISRPGRVSNRRFSSTSEVVSEMRSRKIEPDAVITVNGIMGSTTPGRVLINDAIPKKHRDYGMIWTDKAIQSKLVEIDKGSGRDAFVKSLQAFADIGRRYAYIMGSSFLLSDLQTMTRERNAAYRRADVIADRIRRGPGSDAEKEEKIIAAYSAVGARLQSSTSLKANASGKTNNVADMVAAGARGNPDQVKQMVSSIGIMLDHTNKPMPEPVRSTYTEGLSTSEFFAHMYGNRKGMIDKSQSVKDPGALTKQVIISAAGYRVVQADCGTMAGVQEPVSGNSALDRYLAEAIPGAAARGELVTRRVLESARSKGLSTVKVRSPLTCVVPNGVCARCYGLNEEGRSPSIGEHVGIKDTQGLTEPTTQLAMKTFHCNHRAALVYARRGETVLAVSMEDLFQLVDSPVIVDGGEEIKVVDGWDVYDGRWVKMTHVRRHAPDSKMVAVTANGAVTICQNNHPVGVWNNNVSCIFCGHHRLKTPSPASRGKKSSCALCGKRQDAPEQKIGQAGFLSPCEIEPKRVYLKSVAPKLDARSKPPDINPYLAGMFVAEGSVGFRRASASSKDKKPYAVVISQNDGSVKSKIASVIPAGVPVTVCEKKFQIHSLELGKKFDAVFGRYSHSKALPPDFIGYAPAWLSGYLCGVIDGDGTIKHEVDGADSINIDTTSFELAQQIIIIANMLGINASMSVSTNRKLTRNQAFRVALRVTRLAKGVLSESIKVQKIEKLSQDAIVPEERYRLVSSVKDVLYTDDYVYDATTETGTLYVSGIKHHNTGGVATGKTGLATGFDRVKKLFTMPDSVRDKAILSERDGRVESIGPDPFGGTTVVISGVKHRLSTSRRPTVKVGDQVMRGQRISDGSIQPQDMLRLNGLRAMQVQLRDDIGAVYAAGGERIHAKTIEVPVRMLTEKVRISDSGDHPSMVTGDHASYGQVDAWNKANPGKKQVKYVHILPGSEFLPHVSGDWAQRMAHNRINQVIRESAASGAKAPLSGGSPFASLVFGKKIDKDPWAPGGLTSG